MNKAILLAEGIIAAIILLAASEGLAAQSTFSSGERISRAIILGDIPTAAAADGRSALIESRIEREIRGNTIACTIREGRAEIGRIRPIEISAIEIRRNDIGRRAADIGAHALSITERAIIPRGTIGSAINDQRRAIEIGTSIS